MCGKCADYRRREEDRLDRETARKRLHEIEAGGRLVSGDELDRVLDAATAPRRRHA